MSWKRAFSLAILAAGLTAGARAASAAGVNLAWDNCVGAGGATQRTFACDTNSGSNVLFVSVRAPAGIAACVALDARLELQSNGSVFPSWWHLRNDNLCPDPQTAQCRHGSLGASAEFSSVSGCTDTFLGQATGVVVAYCVGYGGPNRARMGYTSAVPSLLATTLHENEEYYVARLVINDAKSVGDGSCAGCLEGVCLVVTEVQVLQQGLNTPVTNPAERNYAVWQSGEASCAGATPTRRATWGAIKSVYR